MPDRFVTLLDSKNNVIGTLSSANTVDFCIPCEDLQVIYDALIDNDIKSLCRPEVLVDLYFILHPRFFYKLTFCLDGEVYSVSYDNAVVSWNSAAYPDLRTFHGILDTYYLNKNEHQSYP